MMNRKWYYKIGNGNNIVLILPRKDGNEMSVGEWEKLYLTLGANFTLIIIDIPEYLCRRNNSTFPKTTDYMADVLNNILVNKKIDNIKVLIGVSLGGMIAQKFIYKYSEIPTIFISTIIKSNLKVQTVFNSWKNNLHFIGEKGFNVNLASWVKGGILEENSLNQSKDFCVIKEELSLEAISSHNFKEENTISKKETLVIFGKNSPLIGMDETIPFTDFFKNITICPIADSGMRVLEENPKSSYKKIKQFIEENS